MSDRLQAQAVCPDKFCAARGGPICKESEPMLRSVLISSLCAVAAMVLVRPAAPQ